MCIDLYYTFAIKLQSDCSLSYTNAMMIFMTIHIDIPQSSRKKSISSVELHLLEQQRTLVKPKMDIENRAYKHFHRFAQIA